MSDPAQLFTPPRSRVTTPADSEIHISDPPQSDDTHSTRDASEGVSDGGVYVSLPTLLPGEKDQYEHRHFSDSDEPGDEDVVAFTGEYYVGPNLYLYARYRDNVHRRKLATEFQESHPQLYRKYLKAKDKGTLEKFDPSAAYVHYAHREGIVINIPGRKPGPAGIGRRGQTKKIIPHLASDDDDDELFEKLKKKKSKSRPGRKSATGSEGFSDDVSEAESEEDDDDDGNDDEDYATRPRRNTRSRTNGRSAGKGKQSKLKFGPPGYSPKKTRSRTGALPAKSRRSVTEEGDGSSEEDRPAARNTRSTTTRSGRNIKPIHVLDSEDEEADFDFRPSKPEKKKRVIKHRAVRPAYGVVRPVEELYDSDPETAPLRAHRNKCEKCRREPAHILLKKLARKGRGRSKRDSDDSSDEEGSVGRHGGWVRCLKCCVAAHWGCLSGAQQADCLKAMNERAKLASGDEDFVKVRTLGASETTDFVCGPCMKGGICMTCEEVAIKPDVPEVEQPKEPTPGDPIVAGASDVQQDVSKDKDQDIVMLDATAGPSSKEDGAEATGPKQLLFRCTTCKRLAHYEHLAIEGDEDLPTVEVARFYQKNLEWECADCNSYTEKVQHILAWRPYPLDYVDPRASQRSFKENLPREYLIKWETKSYRHLTWVPHMWLLSTHQMKLKNFMTNGPTVPLLEITTQAKEGPAVQDEFTLLAAADAEQSQTSSKRQSPAVKADPHAPAPDAEQRVPLDWKSVDRILDIRLWYPHKKADSAKKRSKARGKGKGKGKGRAVSDEEDEGEDRDLSPDAVAALKAAQLDGELPDDEFLETPEQFQKRTGEDLAYEDIDEVITMYVKWKDLQYEEATWDVPPQRDDPTYASFEEAFRKYLEARDVFIEIKSADKARKFDQRSGLPRWSRNGVGIPESGEYDIGQDPSLKLMDFQVVGVNWLCENWFNHQQCILADEMGLGKTVQLVTFLGIIANKLQASPALVVVPNSTVTNWMREFAKWAPHLRCVAFHGMAKSRELVKEYEMYHAGRTSGMMNIKFHVLVTTYDTVTNSKEFSTFKGVNRWEVLVIDEGQRLKSDSSLLFRKLKELKTIHRILMTGTPLNNNIRELFNLMNFLDPDKWADLQGLEKYYEELNDDLIKELHERLWPYFLRRVKADVLKLPPKNEVIVPVTMSSLQKEIYKGILSGNVAALRNIAMATSRSGPTTMTTANMNNILMQLRKCLQHPYLMSRDIEPKGLDEHETHLKLVDASAKLRLLKIMLPKLKARGHRVLLFSQFTIALDVIEDFLNGEGYNFLRLDGNVKQEDRQKDMDEFNKAGSDVFIYLLSTRAGGVGINLWSADTVIVFDPDFNPHMDLQAIARSHRFGQTKTCLVFKLMVKDSAEEKIIQAGKKKMALDHLIVQKMDKENSAEDVQSILMFGAKALFEEETSDGKHDINYSEHDIEQLIEKTEKEGDEVEQSSDKSKSLFEFAKVWSSRGNGLEELADNPTTTEDADSWAQALAKIAAAAQQNEVQEKTGRGVRRRAAQFKTYTYIDASPEKPVATMQVDYKSASEVDDDYRPINSPSHQSVAGSDAEIDAQLVDDDLIMDIATLQNDNHSKSKGKKKAFESVPAFRLGDGTALAPIENRGSGEEMCGLCQTAHGPGGCVMTKDSSNLVEYRKMLLEQGPSQDRDTAIYAIEEVLGRRGALHLIHTKAGHIDQHKKVKQTTKEKMPSLMSKFSGAASSSKSSHGVKRSSDPAPAGPSSEVKKPKLKRCPICKTVPHHEPKECPAVQKGPDEVLAIMRRLDDDGRYPSTTDKLRKIYRKLVAESQA